MSPAGTWSRLRDSWQTPAVRALLTAGLAAALLLPTWHWLDDWYSADQRANYRAVVKDHTTAYAAGVADVINRRLSLIDGLYAFVQSQLSSPTYESDLKSFATGLYSAAPGIRAIEVIPGSTIRFVYPLEGNESAVNHDLSTDPRPEVRADLERARRMRRSCLTGPVELRQGGLGLIVRRSVYRDDQFWGYVTIILDVNPTLKEATPPSSEIVVSIRDAQDRVFLGNPAIFQPPSVIERVALPDGDWEVAAMPVRGWGLLPGAGVVMVRYLLLSLVLAICSVVYLLTERQTRLALAVRAGEAEYRLVTDAVPVLIAGFDSARRCRFANLPHEAWFNCTREELTDRGIAEILGPDVARTIDGYVAQLTAGTHVTFDAALQLPRGGLRDVTITCVPRVPDGFYLVATDITARNQAEKEHQKLAALVEMSRESIGIATLDGAITYLNPAGLMLVGFDSVEQARQSHLVSIFAPEDHDVVRDQILKVVLSSGSWTGESRLRNVKTGARIDVEMTVFQIRGADGSPLYLATITRDVTERKRAMAERQRLEGQLTLARKMESVGRLAGGVAHDFNNLLTIINGFTELSLKSTGAATDIRPYLIEVDKAGRRAADLTRQLLTFSRRQVIELGPLNPARVLDGMASMLRTLVRSDVNLILVPREDTWNVLADQGQLEQVLMNLAINARDAMPEGGQLTMETVNVEVSGDTPAADPGVAPGAYVLITVTDTGIGMDAAIRDQIFEPFFTTKKEGAGTGLGLATVFGIVQQCNGSIAVSSEPGQGASFRIYLPRAAPSAEPAMSEIADPELHGLETILVVDDNPEVREFTVLSLRGFGYRVLDAGSGQDALEMLGRHSGAVELLLTDVVMPSMNGRMLASLVQAQRPDTKVLYMSGYTGKVAANDPVAGPGVEFLSKPFSSRALAEKVRGVLGRRVTPRAQTEQ